MTSAESPKNKRLELGEQSREVILDAATRLMSARGYEGTSISAIAKESGLPASSIYWHFASKVGVLTAVMDRGNERFYAEAESSEIPQNGSHFDKILAILQNGLKALEANPDFVRLQFILLLNSPEGHVNETVLRMRRQAREGIRAGLITAFADLGAARAEAVAANLANFTGASFDGIFLDHEKDPTETPRMLRELAYATVALALADQITTSDPDSPDSI